MSYLHRFSYERQVLSPATPLAEQPNVFGTHKRHSVIRPRYVVRHGRRDVIFAWEAIQQ